MRRGMLAFFILATMVFAGCIGPSAPDWGKSSDAVHVQANNDGTYTLTPFATTSSRTLSSVGCDTSKDSNSSENDGIGFEFTGYLASSFLYDSHEAFEKSFDDSNDLTVIRKSTAISVAIQSMSFEQAGSIVAGEGPRIDLKSWEDPLAPDTGAGSVDLTKFELEENWYVLGLIPTSENILDGMVALTEWHQPVAIKGKIAPINSNLITATSNCALSFKGSQGKITHYVYVEEIAVEGGLISQNGDDQDEWVHGDVAFVGGRAGYISSFFIFGLGGAVAAFVFSKTMLLKDAKDQMKILVGDEGMSKVAKVKTDMKVAKKEGMESPEERLKRQRKEAEEKAKIEQRKSSTILPSEGDKDQLGGFDLDSVLASAGKSSRNSGPGAQTPVKKSSASVVTTELPSVGSSKPAPEPEPAPESPRTRGPPPSTRSSVSVEPAPSIPEPKHQPPVRRRAVKSVAETPEEPDEAPSVEPVRRGPPQRQTYNDDEDDDFSNFSF
jgi:hypothetical protein